MCIRAGVTCGRQMLVTDARPCTAAVHVALPPATHQAWFDSCRHDDPDRASPRDVHLDLLPWHDTCDGEGTPRSKAESDRRRRDACYVALAHLLLFTGLDHALSRSDLRAAHSTQAQTPRAHAQEAHPLPGGQRTIGPRGGLPSAGALSPGAAGASITAAIDDVVRKRLTCGETSSAACACKAPPRPRLRPRAAPTKTMTGERDRRGGGG